MAQVGRVQVEPHGRGPGERPGSRAGRRRREGPLRGRRGAEAQARAAAAAPLPRQRRAGDPPPEPGAAASLGGRGRVGVGGGDEALGREPGRAQLGEAVADQRLDLSRQPCAVHVVDELVEVSAQAVHVGPARLVEPPREHVHRHPVLGELHGRLDADHHVRVVGDLEGSRDRVVIRERHEVHPAPLGRRVGGLRLGERLRHHGLGEEPAPGVGRRPGVQVQVDPALVVGPAGCGGAQLRTAAWQRRRPPRLHRRWLWVNGGGSRGAVARRGPRDGT
jgi:hypothetical protein